MPRAEEANGKIPELSESVFRELPGLLFPLPPSTGAAQRLCRDNPHPLPREFLTRRFSSAAHIAVLRRIC